MMLAPGFPGLLLPPGTPPEALLTVAVTVVESALIAGLWVQSIRRRRVERALTERLTLDRLIARLSTDMIGTSSAQLDEKIEAAIAEVLEALNLDCGGIVEIDAEESCGRITHFAEAHPGAPRLDMITRAEMPWLYDELQAGRSLSLSALKKDLPATAEGERALADEQEIKSLFVTPVTGAPHGMRSLVVCRAERNALACPVDIQASLQLLGKILGETIVRRRADEALRRSEEESRAILRAIPDLIFILDRNGVYLDYHVDDVRDLFVPPGAFVGRHFRDVLPTELAERLQLAFDELMATDEMQMLEYSLPFGEAERSFEARIVSLGRDRVLTVIREVSDRQRTEAELRASEQRYRTVVETQTELVCRYLPDTTLTFVNEAYCRFYGQTRDQLIGKKFIEFIPSPAREAAQMQVLSLVGHPRIEVYEHEVVDPNGNIRLQQWINRAIHDKSGRVIELQGIGRDVTEYRQAERALQESERRRRLATAAGGVGVWEWIPETGAVITDPILKELIGCTADEIPDNIDGWRARIHPLDMAKAAGLIQAHLAGHTVTAEMEVRLAHKDGGFRWFLARGSAVRDQHGQVVRVIGTNTDISERMRAAEAWRRSEQRLYRLREANVVGMAIADRRGRIHEANDEFLRLVGRDRAKLQSGELNYQEMVPEKLHPTLEAFVKKLYRTGIGSPIEMHYLRPDGSGIPALLGAVRLDDEDYLSLSVIVDLSAQKRAEQALRQSEDRYARATAAAGVGVWEWDLTSNTLFVDPALKTLLGFEDHEIGNYMGDWARHMHHADLRRIMAQHQRHLTGAESAFDAEYRMIHKDGSFRWFHSRGTIERDTLGKPVRMLGTSTDITKRRLSEEAARESEHRFQVLADAAPVLIWMSDPHRHLTYVNKGWLDFTGRSSNDGLARGWFDLVHPEDIEGCLASYHRAVHAHQPFTMEYRFRRHDGVYRWLLNHGVPRSTPEGRFIGYIGSCLDITERKNDEAELQQSRQELAHLSRVSSLGALSSALAHELNQPLGAILSNAQAALRFLNHQPPNLVEVRDILRDIATEDQRAGDVIRHMRLLLRRGQPQFVPVEPNQIVNEIVRLMRSEMMHRGTAVDLELAEDLPVIPGDRVQLQQVLINLLLNGAEAMMHLPPAERRIQVRTQRQPDEEVGIDVADAGSGIKPEDMRRLFAPFFTTKKQGLGVGLAICKSIVDAHGGRLWADNNSVRGATFHLRLSVSSPMAVASPPPTPMRETYSAYGARTKELSHRSHPPNRHD